ncbi:MAG: type I DNA topoisomerase, partial [Deltaproteobacteria bacterium]|nr:type I DNA topoisomerase [Deltaproteobacteria bacterium]
DREGESISWHLVEVLKPKIPVKRMVFHEITNEAIAAALESPRAIDDNLVRAQETRRLVDRLFGYSVSPLLWKKMKPRLSAGRVQSVAIRLLVERERERISFRSGTYWDLKGVFSKAGSSQYSDQFEAELTHVGGKRVAIGKDFDAKTGKLLEGSDSVLLNEKSAGELKQKLLNSKTLVSSVEEKPYTTKPAPPFTTSTLQQEASRKLNFSARRTMQIAQVLYENGLITYMRTDSTILSEEALKGARNIIVNDFGEEYLHPEPRIYKTKVKNAQEAHEAIRPAGQNFAPMSVVQQKFGVEAFKLYELIWKRTLASQMKDATGTRISVQLTCADATFRASGKTIEFAGFLRAYVEGSDDPEADLADREKILPKLAVSEPLDIVGLDAYEHQTQPPARYTEGSLIKELERLGIGRPSTWASIVDLVLSRDYAFKKGTALVPTFLATAVIGLMERYFTKLVDYEFTALLEDDLDSISRGEKDYRGYLQRFYFGNGHPGLKSLVENGEKVIDPRDVCGIPIGVDQEGRQVEVRIGRFGPFLANGENRSGLPEMITPDELNTERAIHILEEAAKGPEALGADPESGKPVYLKKGRFGPYIQLGEMAEGEDKPKMVSLLQGMDPSSVTLDIALQLLSFPKSLGKHPETGEDVVVANGRYGPYIKTGDDTRTIPSDDEITLLNITLEQALEILKQPKRRGRQSAPKNLREIGVNPVTNAAIALKSGRYGPYVTDGKINASLPRGMDPAAITLQDAINLLDARAARLGQQGEGEDEAQGSKKKGRKGTGKSKAKSEEKPKAAKAKSKKKSTKSSK